MELKLDQHSRGLVLQLCPLYSINHQISLIQMALSQDVQGFFLFLGSFFQRFRKREPRGLEAHYNVMLL